MPPRLMAALSLQDQGTEHIPQHWGQGCVPWRHLPDALVTTASPPVPSPFTWELDTAHGVEVNPLPALELDNGDVPSSLGCIPRV